MGSRPSCLELIFIIYSYNLLVADRRKRQQENARRCKKAAKGRPKGSKKNAKRMRKATLDAQRSSLYVAKPHPS